VNARDSVISLAGNFLSWHIPLGRRDLLINLQRAKTCTHFLRESLLFKWINKVCRSTIFCEICPEYSLINMERKCVTKFFNFKYFSCGSLLCNTLREFFNSGTWQIYKKITNRNKRKCWHTLRDWCFVINTAQLFCISDCIWYPINSLELQMVHLALTGSASLGKQSAKHYNFIEFYVS